MSKSFGLVQPTLIQQIKKILDQYPDDGQILKELIQNAEDAGAREVKFLYDKHSYGTKKLCNTKLAKFQGPALYAYNNAKFTNRDWEGIGMLCDSIKEKDPTKVGRFGLGFKSVFHMTDFPSVISGDCVGIIDPEEKYFSDDDGKRSGQKWHLKQDRKDIRKNSDQFAPYKGIFGCEDEIFKRGSYEGTLFRLPLRQEASKLSDTIYSREKMRDLLECFEKDAHLILLFLMNLERIEVYEREEDCSQPRKLFHVGISADCLLEVRKAREEFEKQEQNNVSALLSGSFPEVKKTYTLTIETVHYDNGVDMKSKHSYVVTLFFSGSDVSQEIKALMTNDSLSYLPLVGVALPLQPQTRARREKGGVVADEDDDNDCELVARRESGSGIKRRIKYSGNERERTKTNVHEPQGHLFCFLPLPLESKSLTGLPVHVNGFFALSQNRRHLKWPSADQDGTLTDKSLLWNKGLLQEVLPKAYAELILHVILCSPRDESWQIMTTSDAYSAWPDINKVDAKWKSILQPLFDILLQYEVLHTDANGGWCRVEEVLLDNLEKSDQSREIVTELLNRTGRNIVTVPAHVETALQQYCAFNLQYVTPKILRSSLKADPSCYAHLNHQDKILLLKFILSDSDFTDLEGLDLLPLSDETFSTFGEELDSHPIYIDSAEHSKSLLPGLQRMFLDTEVDADVIEQLKRAVKKGYTQLCHFNKETVKQLLRQSLPSDWQGSEVHVPWSPGRSKQLTIEWFRALWKYFGRHFSASDLEAFVGLPLIPVTPLSNQSEVQLARIQRPSSLLLPSFNGENIDESLCQLLKDLGLTILQDLPDYIRYYPRLVPNLTNPPSPKGVLNAVGVIFESPQEKSAFLQRMREQPAKKIRCFRRFLSTISSPLKNVDFKLLQILPLFETYPGSGGRESLFVSAKEVNIGAPIDGLPPVSVFTELLDLRDHSSSVLAHLLNIKPMSHNDLLKIMLEDALDNKYRQSELDELVKYTLDRFGIFRGEYFKTIKQKMQHLSFVPSGGKSRKKPSELYDPEQNLLKQVFSGEDVFPKENSYYSHPDVLSHLRKLGLKGTESVTASDILRSAQLQASKRSIKDDKTRVKSQAILKLLERKPSLLDDKVKSGQRKIKLKECLYSIPWIPVLTEKPATYPIHLSLKQIDNGNFACPKDVTSHEFVSLVGSVKLLADTGNIPRVSQGFKWHQNPAIEDVIRHLYKVIATFQESIDLEKRSIREVLEKLYEYFQMALSKNGRDRVNELLSPMDFILINEQLFPARKLAFSSSVLYPPYLNQLPDSYKYRFDKLFKAVGVRESFGIGDYIETLQMVKDKYGENPVTEELAQVKSVLNSLAEVMSKEEVDAKEAMDKYGSIYIPDSHEIMKLSLNVYVKDCYWMPSEPDVSYINEGVSPQVCITLGAKTIRQETLCKHTFGLPFGQKEKLTNRLKRILTGYPCDESIMKELLQNADDAKATKVCFINDPRQHPDERVFEESWKPLQGPALCVYNNAPFTESDIQGIQNLGEGSKGDDPNKTGQYGVGFNAVYHLTDVPTFISQGEEIGEVMCVFDPNLNFVPDADASNPGMLYTELPTLRKTFPDVFSCYDLQQYFPLTNATMFRLPLRNKEIARTSKISNKAMTTQKLEELLDNFKNELLQVLLFVNNVNEVSICEIDTETGELSESYRVQSSLSPDDEKKRTDFSTYVNRVGENLRNKRGISVTGIPLEKVSYVVELKDSRGLKQKWLVVQQIGFENPEKITDNVEEAFERGDLGLLPRGGVASLIRSSEDHQDVQGKAFCFLPLPFKTGLPVHVNGHFALNHEDRRSLWRDDKSDYRSNWNEALLQQVVAPCYLTLLDRVRQHIWLPRKAGKTYLKADLETGRYVLLNYYKLFPTLEAQKKYWKTLCKEVYRLMDEKVLRLLPVLRQENKESLKIEWLPPTGKGRDQSYFDNLVEIFKQDKKRVDDRRNVAHEKEELLRNTLLTVGFNLLCIPLSIYSFFKSSGVNVKLISPTDVISFFQTYETKEQLCNVGSLPLNIRDTQFKNIHSLLEVVKYCKREDAFLQRLEGLPLLLTEDEVLRVFGQSHKVFLSRYYELLPNCRSVFLHHNLHLIFSCDIQLVPVFEIFDIAAFARLLPYELDQEEYETASICINWCPEKKEDDILSKQWVRQVWKFFSCHIAEVIKSYEERQSDQRRRFPQMTYSEEKQMEEEDEKRDKEAKKRIIQEELDPVKNWCLLPAFRAHHHFSFSQVEYTLIPIAMSKSVIVLQSSSKGFSSLNETLTKMFLPQLNCKLIDGGYSEGASKTARQLVATLDDPQSVLTLLLRKCHSDPTSFEVLQEEDCRNVLGYFNNHLAQLEPSHAKELRRLPLYATIHDAVISIIEKKVFVLSPRIPKEDMDIWEEKARIVFLKRSISLKRLYKFLECHYEDEVDIYCDVIFKNFEEMSEKARLKHMAFVRELMKELENVRSYFSGETIEENKRKLSRLTNGLSQVRFITAQDGTIKTACSFYDPSSEVFKTMFEGKQDMFPPKPFCEWEWLSFLRRIGLIHEVSDEQFVQFAQEVDAEAKTSPDDGTRRKSEALVTYLFKSENIASSMLLDDVKDICFIFPHVVDSSLLAIHDQYGPGDTGSPCICFRGSVASKNHDIAWTTANFLPDYASPFYHGNLQHLSNQNQKPKRIAQQLGILQSPTVEMVVTHCRNICNVLYQISDSESSPRKENKKVSQKVVTIMTNIYKNLQSNYEDNKETIDKLKDARCIVVDEGKRFVFPNQVAVDITSEQEIPPYLYKIPLEVATYEKLFKNLGTTNTVTAVQYSMVLNSIHDESGKKKLHPNEIRDAFKGTKGFFETFDNDDVQVTEITPLYLPGVKQNSFDPSMKMVFLRMSGEILYNDAQHLKERLRQFDKLILVKLVDCELQANNEDLVVKKLPESLRPRMLTSVVHETLLDENQHVSCSSTAQELRHVLTSSEFCHGIIRLIKHADYKSDKETSTAIPPLVQERLRCIRVYSVPNLQTRLVYNGRAIPGSEANVSCFEEETEENQKVWKIYIEKDAELSDFDSVFAEIIDRITGHHLETMLVHLPKLLSSRPYDIKRLLDRLKIREDNSELQIEATCFPTPGNFIHMEDHHLLVDDFTVFSPGEYVGYELDDPSLREEDGTPTYIYAIVIEEVIEDGQPSNIDASMRKYRIDIGKDKEPIVVDAADLYKFYRPSQGSSECLELELFTGIPEHEKKPVNLDEAKKEIRRILEEAWNLPADEKRKKIIKRLFLKWHPDKNPGNEQFCTEVFKFIQQEIQRLEEGLPVKPQGASRPRKESDHSYSGYSSFFKRWTGRAKKHKRQSRSFHSAGGFSTSSWGSSSSHRSNPQPGEARRWYNQAKADLEAASNDVQYQRTSYEWACFKCHQSAEKSLKAAQYSIDADKTNVHNLRMIALDLNNATLSTLASDLESLVGDSTRMRYPDRVRYPEIPNSVYTSTMALQAIPLAKAIIQEVESKFIN